MNTQLFPESLESRIAPAAISGVGEVLDEQIAGPQPEGAAPAPLVIEPESVIIPRSGNVDLDTLVPDITTVPVDGMDLTELSAEAAAAVAGVRSTLDILATSALAGETAGIGALGIGSEDGTAAGIDTTSALESGASNIADLVLIKTGDFASASAESLLIVKI